MANTTKSKSAGKQGTGGVKKGNLTGKRISGKSVKGSSGTTRADYEDEPRTSK